MFIIFTVILAGLVFGTLGLGFGFFKQSERLWGKVVVLLGLGLLVMGNEVCQAAEGGKHFPIILRRSEPIPVMRKLTTTEAKHTLRPVSRARPLPILVKPSG